MAERKSVGSIMDLSQLEKANDRPLTSELLLVILLQHFIKRKTVLKRDLFHDRIKELEETSKEKWSPVPCSQERFEIKSVRKAAGNMRS